MELKKFVPSVAEIHGASPLAASVLVQQVLGKGALDRSAGDVTVIIKGTFREGGPESAGLVMATSPVSALPYYYGVAGSTLVHGPSVFKIAQGLGRASEWKWNNRALASLLALGHTIGADTLHSDIRRIPAATLVMHSAGQTIEKSYTVAAEERSSCWQKYLKIRMLCSGSTWSRPAAVRPLPLQPDWIAGFWWRRRSIMV